MVHPNLLVRPRRIQEATRVQGNANEQTRSSQERNLISRFYSSNLHHYHFFLHKTPRYPGVDTPSALGESLKTVIMEEYGRLFIKTRWPHANNSERFSQSAIHCGNEYK
jgi:hypothetical protein